MIQINRSPFKVPPTPPELASMPKRMKPIQIHPRTRRSVWLSAAIITTAIGIVLIPQSWDRYVALAYMVPVLTLWIYWNVKDMRAALRTVADLPGIDPAEAPRIVMPLRHWLVPAGALFVLGTIDFDGTISWVARGLYFTMIALVLGQAEYIRYKTLPQDSIEASVRRDAAAVSFLIVTAAWWCIGFVGGQWASGNLDQTIPPYLALALYAPVIAHFVIYYGATLALRRTRT